MFSDHSFRRIAVVALSLAGPLLASSPLESLWTGWERVPVGEPGSQAVAGGSMMMVLEASEDLATWTETASNDGGPQEWIPLTADATIDPETRGIRLPTTPSGHGYFRLRTDKLNP
jgi:hypothetical protein